MSKAPDSRRFGRCPAAEAPLRRFAAWWLPLAVAGCAPAVLEPRGPIGAAERTILIDSLAIMLAIVVPVIVATLGAAWWFRASNGRARFRPDWAFSGRIEVVVWSIPLMTILLLGGVAWIGSHALDPATPLARAGGASSAAGVVARVGAAPAGARPQPDAAAQGESLQDAEVRPLEVQAISLDWKWLFIYPAQGVASVNRLVVPAGRPVRFRLTSASVLNTFFVPQLGSMIYVMNGMTSELYLQADQAGRYRGQSAHFSGEGFSDMHFAVEAVPAAEFERWAGLARDNAAVLDTPAYVALAEPSIAVPPHGFGAVEPGLFERIVARAIAPAPGPSPTRADGPQSSSSAPTASSSPGPSVAPPSTASSGGPTR